MITINIIGFGNVASHLISHINTLEDYTIQAIYSRSKNTTQNLPIVNDINELRSADITLISVTDDAIAELSARLPYQNSLIAHTSGTVSIDEITHERRGVFYPLQTFSKQKEVDFSEIPLCLEATNSKDYALLENLALKLTKKVYSISSLQRKKIHITAVFVCNFVNHLFTIGKDIADENDIPFEIFMPLIQETVNKIKTLDPAQAQTGPAIRNDFLTIEQHLLQISNNNYKNIYKLLSNSIIQHGKKL